MEEHEDGRKRRKKIIRQLWLLIGIAILYYMWQEWDNNQN